MTEYEKTPDPNIIKQTEAVVSEIHLDKLHKQIDDLTTQIENIHEPIVCPKDASDEIIAAVEFWNQMNAHTDRGTLEAERKEKQDLIDMLKKL